jgi:imidazolonepropionase-like amidohydrolase
MISFFLLSLPIFAVIGVGWAATRTRLVAQCALDAIGKRMAIKRNHTLPGLLTFLLLAAATAPGQTSAAPQLIRDVRVFDGERVLEHRNVLLEDGKISRIDGPDLKVANAEVVDGQGRTLLPGLIDAHVHLPNPIEKASHQALVLGVTTQLDMFNGGDRLKLIKKLQSEDRPDLADMRTAGTGATVPGGHPTEMGGGPIPTITAPGQAQSFVDARIAEGSDYIKIIHDDGSTWAWTTKRVPMLDNPTMRAVVEAAHKRGRMAVVHVLSEQQARDAIAAGADGLAHMFVGETVSPDFGRFVSDHHAFVIPTLATLYPVCGQSQGQATLADPSLAPYIGPGWRPSMELDKPNPKLNHLCNGTDEAIRQLVRAHVPILTGTDAPVPGSTYGASAHVELALLVHDGLTPAQALAAATSVPARTFHLADRGWIRPGLRADIVLVQGDPTTDILATRNIVAVWKRGIRVERSLPAPPSPPEREPTSSPTSHPSSSPSMKRP